MSQSQFFMQCKQAAAKRWAIVHQFVVITCKQTQRQANDKCKKEDFQHVFIKRENFVCFQENTERDR